MHDVRFTILMTRGEREALDRLASLWRRSRSDVLRLLLASALSQLFTETSQDGTAVADRRQTLHGATPSAGLPDSLGNPQGGAR